MGTIGSKGVGAGEFIEIEDVAVDKKGEKIFVLDHSGKRILIYDLKGNFANDIKTDFIAHEIEYLENGNLACYCDYSEFFRIGWYFTGTLSDRKCSLCDSNSDYHGTEYRYVCDGTFVIDRCRQKCEACRTCSFIF